MSTFKNSMSSQTYPVIDTATGITSLIDSLVDLVDSSLSDENAPQPSLYLDLEGVNLSRHGTISLMQLLLLPQNDVYIIDIHTLGAEAFSTPGANGQTLKIILESETIAKAFFDVRNDSDALYSHFGINLAGIQDVQVMEFATRNNQGDFLSGLARCISNDIKVSWEERERWIDIKDRGRELFAPELGGYYEVFNERPLSLALQQYCAMDVQRLPQLWLNYSRKLKVREPHEREIVAHEAKIRVEWSQDEDYVAHGKHKTRGPSWDL